MWPIGDWWMLWNSSSIYHMHQRMVLSHSRGNGGKYILVIVSHLLWFLRVPETWYFVCNLAVNLSETYNSVTHKWLTDAVNIFFELPYALNKGYGALQKQWMSILLVHHPIFNTYKGSPTLYFCLFDRQYWWKWQGVTYKWQADAVKRTTHTYLYHAPNEQYDTPKISNGGLSIRYRIP